MNSFEFCVQHYGVDISRGSQRRILYVFLEEVIEGYCLHLYMKLQKDTV